MPIESEIAPTRSVAAAIIAFVAIGCGLVTANLSAEGQTGVLWQTAVAAFSCGMAVVQWFARREVERWLLVLCLLAPVVLMAIAKLMITSSAPFIAIIAVLLRLL